MVKNYPALENCIQCGGSGQYVPAGQQGYPCGFCMAKGLVPVNTQWLHSPRYVVATAGFRDWSNWFAYMLAASFIIAVVGVVILLVQALQTAQTSAILN